MKYFSLILLFLALPLSVLAQGTEFVALTNIPAITEVGNAITTPEGLSIFLNNIYKLCIGVAAVVAVLQIMRAGIMYMGGDSVTEKKEAKNLIALSIGGLILVLSPVVVFSIINPEILSLKIGNIDKLKPESSTSAGGRVVPAATAQECREKGGVPTGAEPNIVCTVPADSDAADAAISCTNFRNITAIPAGATCDTYLGDDKFAPIQQVCCSGAVEGQVCCGIDKTLPVSSAYSGQFMGKISKSDTGADAFRNSCDTSNINPDVRRVVSSRNLASTQDALYCESRSELFFKYQLKNRESGAVTQEHWVPDEEQKNRIYSLGCSGDVGTLQNLGPNAWSAWGACSTLFDKGAGVQDRVFAAIGGGITKETHELRCRAYQSRCIKY